MEIIKKTHPHHFRNKYLLYQGGYNSGGGGTTSNFQLPDWFYMDENSIVHSKYDFVGDGSVSAYGYSEDGDAPVGGGGVLVDGREIHNLIAGNNIFFGGTNNDLIISSIGGSGGEGGGIDPRITDLDISNWNSLILSAHTHNNKSVLDNLTQSVIDNSHTHTNKTVLDGITSTKVSNWDDAASKSHTHSNKAVLDNLTQSVIDNSHTHTNKSDLDKIKSGDIDKWNNTTDNFNTSASTWNEISDKFNDWFYKDEKGVHSKYDFIGDNAVSAYGTSTGEGGSGGDGITVSGKTINELLEGTNIKFNVNGNQLTISSVGGGTGGNDPRISDADISNWNNSTLSAHTHSNKTTLDGITSTKVNNWDNTYTNHISGVTIGTSALTVSNHKITLPAYPTIPTSNTAFTNDAGYLTEHQDLSNYALKSELHSHTNKSVLDGITSTKVSNWDNAASKAHSHTNKSVLDNLTQSVIDNSHTHSNKTELDKIKDGDKAKWDETTTKLNDWFYLSGNSLHTKYDLVGDKSISCYGETSSESGGDGVINADGRNINVISAGTNITFGGDGSTLVINSVGGGTGGNDPRISDSNISSWNNLILSAHTHNNKGVLDNLTQSVIDNSHTHTNKTVLDGITSTKVSNWDGAVNNHISGVTLGTSALTVTNHKITLPAYPTIPTSNTAFTNDAGYLTEHQDLSNYALKSELHSHSNKTVLDGITSTKVSNWDDAASKAHSHTNKTTLDSITSTKVNNWDNTNSWVTGNSGSVVTSVVYNEVTGTSVSDGITKSGNSLTISGHSHTNKDALDLFYVSGGVVHCSVDFIGDNAVSAYGTSTGESGTNSGSIKVGSDEVNELSGAGGTSITVSGNIAKISSHTHTNQSILNTLNLSNITNWNNAANNAHSHTNKSVLDGITSTKISNWDGVVNNYISGVTIGTSALTVSSHNVTLPAYPTIPTSNTAFTNDAGYLTEHQDLSSYALKSELHSHTNKSVLDGITSTKVSNWDNAFTNQNNYLPLSGGTLTGHLLLGGGTDTAFKKVETVRNINGVPNGAAFYTNSDGTAAFFHKTYSSTALTGAVNDAILKFDCNGLYFAQGANNRTTATTFKKVVLENDLANYMSTSGGTFTGDVSMAADKRFIFNDGFSYIGHLKRNDTFVIASDSDIVLNSLDSGAYILLNGNTQLPNNLYISGTTNYSKGSKIYEKNNDDGDLIVEANTDLTLKCGSQIFLDSKDVKINNTTLTFDDDNELTIDNPDNGIVISADYINLNANTEIDGDLHVKGNIIADGAISCYGNSTDEISSTQKLANIKSALAPIANSTTITTAQILSIFKQIYNNI